MHPLILILIISFTITWTESCAPSCRECIYKNHSNRSGFIKYMSDEKKLNDVTLMGTHLSAVSIYQDLSIADQLKYGIRVLDLTVRATSNKFALHYNVFFLNRMLGDVLNDVNRFLDDNPHELVIVLFDEVHTPASDVTKSSCQILDSYVRWNTIKIWSLDNNIGMYRGNILFATLKKNSFSECIVNLKTQCQISSANNQLSAGPSIRKILEIGPTPRKSRISSRSCVIKTCDYDHNDEFSIPSESNLLDTGILKCKASRACISANRFPESHYRGFHIMLADFPTQELIDSINNSN